jgi:hypothetical protein
MEEAELAFVIWFSRANLGWHSILAGPEYGTRERR